MYQGKVLNTTARDLNIYKDTVKVIITPLNVKIEVSAVRVSGFNCWANSL